MGPLGAVAQVLTSRRRSRNLSLEFLLWPLETQPQNLLFYLFLFSFVRSLSLSSKDVGSLTLRSLVALQSLSGSLL